MDKRRKIHDILIAVCVVITLIMETMLKWGLKISECLNIIWIISGACLIVFSWINIEEDFKKDKDAIKIDMSISTDSKDKKTEKKKNYKDVVEL